MSKKCPSCNQIYTNDYDICILCNVELKSHADNTTINRRGPIISRGSAYTETGQSQGYNTHMGNGGVQQQGYSSGMNSGTYQNGYNTSKYSNINNVKKDNIIIKLLRSIGIFVTSIFTFFGQLFKGREKIVCRGIMANSVITGIEEEGKTFRFLRGLFLGTPYSSEGNFSMFQICEIDSAGRPIKNKAYSIKVYGKLSGQLLPNNEVEIYGYRNRYGEIVANRVINVNSGAIISVTGAINMLAVRNAAIVVLIGIILMLSIKITTVQGEMSIFDTIVTTIVNTILSFVIKLLDIILPLVICIYGFKVITKGKFRF